MATTSKIVSSVGGPPDFPRSPTSISPVSSRRDSLRRSDKAQQSARAPATPDSPPMRLTRQRAASLALESGAPPLTHRQHRGEHGGPASTLDDPRPSTPREQVCICQPDPKIPRPRNAFILYRQHYQAQVVAQHPGLANPEISKIIGEQWRDQPNDVKNEWKRLAEEEKARHQRQYPEYRYQPRRAGRANGGKSTPGEDPGRCLKCHGRYTASPGTPLTTPAFTQPFTPQSSKPLLTPFNTPSRQDEYTLYSSHGGLNTPRTMPPPGQAQRRAQYPPGVNSPGMSSTPLGRGREREIDHETAMDLPQFKRRRFEDDGRRYPSPSPYEAHQQRLHRAPLSLVGHPEERDRERRMPLPGPGPMILHRHNSSMEPPPRPSPTSHHYMPRNAAFDESLRLPPLQTQLPSSPPSRQIVDIRAQHKESHARSVEAMVMTIPFMNKIKVLSRTSPALAVPGPSSPAHDVRGAIIAVEGADAALVAEVGRFIDDCLAREEEYAVRSWVPDGCESPRSNSSPILRSEAGDAMFTTYLSTILSWHRKSSEMASYITTRPSTPMSSRMPSPPLHHKTSSPNRSPIDMTMSATGHALGGKDGALRMPIALLPKGYSLTTSDHFASLMPINDAYAPVDHWQWTATLWRGTVGPDLTIYVTAPGSLGEEGSLNAPGVEVVNDCKTIVVKAGLKEGGGLAVEERNLRRLGFEVLEYVRGIGAGSGGEGGYHRI